MYVFGQCQLDKNVIKELETSCCLIKEAKTSFCLIKEVKTSCCSIKEVKTSVHVLWLKKEKCNDFGNQKNIVLIIIF